MWVENIEGHWEELTEAQNRSPGLRGLDIILGQQGTMEGAKVQAGPGQGYVLGWV